VHDRNGAEALKGIELSVDRDRLPEPEPDEFLVADLIGLTAERRDGTILGAVIAVHNYGAGDVIELRPVQGGETLLVPFTRETVPEVDIATGRVLIDPPEGLVEE
jgi:16S rRNA processing protein RimM